MARVDVLVYYGITFRRYPDSPNWADRSYYGPSGADRARGVESLHREIYKREVGPIPDGWHVHHADHDPAHNDAANLVAMPPSEHLEQHDHPGGVFTPEARAAAAEWHRSPAGRAQAGNAARASWVRAPVDRICDRCGSTYPTYFPARARFCSQYCRNHWRLEHS